MGDNMRKKYVEKRTKFISNTYMREAVDYDVVTIKEGNLFITIKKYKKMNGKFTLPDSKGNQKIYIDENYYLLELTPIEENYNIRFYFDENKKFIDYYIDITYKNGVEHKMPYYVDLYLDIIHYPDIDRAAFCDEDELKEALDNKIISKKDYEKAYRIGNKLLKEIENNTNKYLKMDVLKYLNQYY